MHYQQTVCEHYKPFWKNGVPVDFTDCDGKLSGYSLVIAPMLYMTRAGIADKMKEYVSNGGTLVLTYWTGIVNENDLCYLGGMPGEMMKLAGLRSEEIDALYDGEHNGVVMEQDNSLSMSGCYTSSELMDQIIPSTAETLGRYTDDFYAGNPCLTVNHYGKGKVYYIASKNDEKFLDDFYTAVRKECGIAEEFEGKLLSGVTVGIREDGEHRYFVLQNYGDDAAIESENTYYDLQTDETVCDRFMLEKNGTRFLYRKK